MRKLLKMCFGSDRALLVTTLSVPVLIVIASIVLELLGLRTATVVIITTCIGCAWSSVLFLAGRYYYEHKEGEDKNAS